MGLQEKIKELRMSKGLSQKKLADAIGVAQSSVNYWEKGQRTPSVDAAQKLADYFNISLDELYDINATQKSSYTSSDVINLFTGNSGLTELIEDIMNQKQLEELNTRIKETLPKDLNPEPPHTLAAHFDGDEYTDEELKEIRRFAEYIKSLRQIERNNPDRSGNN